MKIAILILTLIGSSLPAFAQSDTNETELVRRAYAQPLLAADKAAKSKARAQLKKLGVEQIRILLDHVHVNNMYIRFDLDTLVRQNAAKAGPHLQDGLASEHERTRKYAAYYLGFTPPGDPTDLLPLLDHPETAGVAMRTLGKWAITNAVPKILPHLAHDDERVRIRAINALRDINDPDAINPLLPSLDDEFFTVRYAAERALSSLATNHVETLTNALPDAAPQTQRHLVRILGAIKNRSALKPLRKFQATARKENELDWGLEGDLRAAESAIRGKPLKPLDSPKHPYVEHALDE